MVNRLMAAGFAAAFIIGITGYGGHSSAVTLDQSKQHHTTAPNPDEDRAQRAERPSRGSKYQRCILHRESRSTNPAPNGSGASGYYQFTPIAWDATVTRMGKPEWAGRHAYTFTRAQQDAVYHAAWRQGNGKFYWSARWGAPYACFPGDTKAMR